MPKERGLIEEFEAQMYRKLKNNVRGFVSFKYLPQYDTYKLKVLRKDVVFKYEIRNLTDELLNGKDSEYYISEIMRLYKGAVNTVFFRQKREDKAYVVS